MSEQIRNRSQDKALGLFSLPVFSFVDLPLASQAAGGAGILIADPAATQRPTGRRLSSRTIPQRNFPNVTRADGQNTPRNRLTSSLNDWQVAADSPQPVERTRTLQDSRTAF